VAWSFAAGGIVIVAVPPAAAAPPAANCPGAVRLMLTFSVPCARVEGGKLAKTALLPYSFNACSGTAARVLGAKRARRTGGPLRWTASAEP